MYSSFVFTFDRKIRGDSILLPQGEKESTMTNDNECVQRNETESKSFPLKTEDRAHSILFSCMSRWDK